MRCKARDEVFLPFPPSMVWRVLADLRAWSLWWPSSTDIWTRRLTPHLVGSQLSIAPRNGWRFICEVRDVVRESHMEMEYVAGPFSGKGLWQVAAAPGGTQLVYTVDLGYRGPFVRFLAFLIDIPALHSRLMRHLFAGLHAHLARQPALEHAIAMQHAFSLAQEARSGLHA